MKKLKAAFMVTLALNLNAIQAPANAMPIQEVQVNKTVLIQNTQLLYENTIAVKAAVKKLSKYVGKTWYVFGGATPAGFDCSGLTLWFYEQLDIQLEHRASKQQFAGTATKDPKPGDLVVFKYKGTKSAYHVGIYIGKGKMIHAPKKGHLTTIHPVKQFAGNYSTVSYRSITPTV